MITPNDLRNPKRKSGFDHVRRANDQRLGRTNPKPFQANGGGRPINKHGVRKNTHAWKGPRRASADLAAQDYCDYINGLGVLAPAALNTPGHPIRPREPVPSEVEAALGVLRDHKAQKRGRQGYVYLIGVKGDRFGVKVGYSVKPEARVGELQTGCPRELQLLAAFPGTESDERALHSKYIKYNLIGEWFTPTLELYEEFGLGMVGGKKTA